MDTKQLRIGQEVTWGERRIRARVLSTKTNVRVNPVDDVAERYVAVELTAPFTSDHVDLPKGYVMEMPVLPMEELS